MPLPERLWLPHSSHLFPGLKLHSTISSMEPFAGAQKSLTIDEIAKNLEQKSSLHDANFADPLANRSLISGVQNI